MVTQKGHPTVVTVMVVQSNTLPDKEEQQSLINEAKLEKQQELQERSKRIEDALPVATKQVYLASTANKNGRCIQLAMQYH